MTVPTITALPDFPVRGEDPVTFAQKANDSVAAYPTMVTQMNAMGEFVEEQAELAAEGGQAAIAAISAANYKGEWSTLSGALAIPASVSHNNSVWLLTESVADVTAVEPGVAAVWQNLTEVNLSAGVTGTLPVANGGTGLTALGTAGQALVVNSGATGLEYINAPSLAAGALQYFSGATTSTYPGTEWLLADGSVLTQTAYPELYANIGLISNGIATWTARTSGTANNIFALTYGDNLYVYGAGLGVLATSTDAITWTARTSGTASNLSALTYGNNLYVYAGDGGVLATSTDAITWTARTSGTSSSIRALIYGDNLYVYAGNGGVLRTSTNAITWTVRISGTLSNIVALTYADGIYVYAAGNGILATSTDAITWTARTSGTTSAIEALAYGAGVYVYAGNNSLLATSTNAITWTARTSGTISTINSLIYGNGVFVYGGSNGVLGTSVNGILWTARTSGTTSGISALTYGNNRYVIAGISGMLRTAESYTYNASTEFITPVQSAIIDNFASGNLYIKAQ
jgi:hypothetical protein